MRERPILFNDEMVRAILAGRKTQTRRPIKLPPAPNTLGEWLSTTIGGHGVSDDHGRSVPLQAAIWHNRTGQTLVCPLASVGEVFYVRECFQLVDAEDPKHGGPVAIPHWKTTPDDRALGRYYRVVYRADGPNEHVSRWIPSIHMPRWASRLLLRVTDVRVERVQTISNDDVLAEGFTFGHGFSQTWDEAYATSGRGWDANPWVWAVTFEVVR